MNRISRNQAYRIKTTGKLSFAIVIRDIMLTLIAWSVAIYFCGDFILQLTYGVLHEFDTDPLNDLDWLLFAKNLKISLLFSGTVLTFIFAWAISNLLLLRRTKDMAGHQTAPLQLKREVQAYGCSEDDVRLWRKEKILTVSIDDTGQIKSVRTD